MSSTVIVYRKKRIVRGSETGYSGRGTKDDVNDLDVMSYKTKIKLYEKDRMCAKLPGNE